NLKTRKALGLQPLSSYKKDRLIRFAQECQDRLENMHLFILQKLKESLEQPAFEDPLQSEAKEEVKLPASNRDSIISEESTLSTSSSMENLQDVMGSSQMGIHLSGTEVRKNLKAAGRMSKS